MNTLFLALALCFSGSSAFAAAMPRHWKQLGLARSYPNGLLRLGGIIALTGAVIACCTIWDPARAIPIAIGLASLGALTVAFALTYAPRMLLKAALVLPLLAGAVALWR